MHNFSSIRYGDELVVLIRHVTSNIYEWHETHPGLSTSIAASDLDWVDVKRQCLLNNWEPLNDPGVSGNCPNIRGDAVTEPCQHGKSLIIDKALFSVVYYLFSYFICIIHIITVYIYINYTNSKILTIIVQ